MLRLRQTNWELSRAKSQRTTRRVNEAQSTANVNNMLTGGAGAGGNIPGPCHRRYSTPASGRWQCGSYTERGLKNILVHCLKDYRQACVLLVRAVRLLRKQVHVAQRHKQFSWL